MRPSQLIKNVLLIALTLALCLGALAPGALATGMDVSRPCSLTIVFADGDKGISGAEFELYHVGGVLESGGFKLSGDFARYGVSLEGLDSSGWRAAAQTLAAYARRDGIAPDSRAETGRDGRALFDSLTPGLYLVTGERTVSGGRVYTPEPFLVSLPGAGEDGEWDYSVAARCKFDDEPKPPDGDTVDVKVLKIWRGDAGQQRTEEITVQLLRDGKVYDTVTLSAENDWRHTWEGLDAAHSWQAVEKMAPEGYTVSISREGITFVITNTLKLSEEPAPTPQPSSPPTPGEPTLPQTGVLWWPVPLLAILGALLLLLGWGLRRRDER